MLLVSSKKPCVSLPPKITVNIRNAVGVALLFMTLKHRMKCNIYTELTGAKSSCIAYLFILLMCVEECGCFASCLTNQTKLSTINCELCVTCGLCSVDTKSCGAIVWTRSETIPSSWPVPGTQ